MIFMGVTDFNVLETTGFFREWFNAYGKAGVCPTDGSSAAAHLPALRGQVPGALSDAHFLAPRPIFVHGLRATDLPGKPARHRDLSARTLRQALPPGHSRWHRQEHAGRRQREPRLAHLSGLRPQPDPDGAQTLYRGQLRRGIDAYGLCARL